LNVQFFEGGFSMAASVRDVATTAGVSVGTVSNVLNNPSKVAKKTVDKVQNAIDQLGFVRNDAARQLRAGRSRSIGLVVLDVRNPFFTDLARGAEDAAMNHNMSVLLANSDETSDRELAMLALFEEQRVHGVLVTPISDNLERFIKARDRGTSIVLVDRKAQDQNFSSVSVDDVAGGYLAAQHLVETGRKRLAFVGGPLSINQVSDRLKGAQKLVDEREGVTLEVIPCRSLSVLSGREVGLELIKRANDDRPDAIFAANDLVAIGIMQACLGVAGISIPADLSLIGYDDISFASTAIVALTSIRQPTHEMGARAVELLMREADAQEGNHAYTHVEFQPELIVRDTTPVVAQL
jgi:LacI family transcriptional regulator